MAISKKLCGSYFSQVEKWGMVGGCGEGSFHRMEAVRETVTPHRLLFTDSWGGRFWKCTELASELAPLLAFF